MRFHLDSLDSDGDSRYGSHTIQVPSQAPPDPNASGVWCTSFAQHNCPAKHVLLRIRAATGMSNQMPYLVAKLKF